MKVTERMCKSVASIVYHKTKGMPDDVGYFHAKWRRQAMVKVNMHRQNLTADYNYPFPGSYG